MKLVSWNVNGLRACVGKGFFEFLAAENPDMMCLQETKLQPEQAPQVDGFRDGAFYKIGAPFGQLWARDRRA